MKNSYEELEVAGARYRKLHIGDIEIQDLVQFERDRENKHHDHAIMMLCNGKKIGYVPAKLADYLDDDDINMLNKYYRTTVAYIERDEKKIVNITVHIERRV